MTEELFREDAYAQRCDATVTAAVDRGVCLDRTVFYCMGGGQPGDRGRLLLDHGAALDVVDTVKEGSRIVHRLTDAVEPPAIGARVVGELDWPRRHRLMRMHSALHLLCAAIARPVTGGQVGAVEGAVFKRRRHSASQAHSRAQRGSSEIKRTELLSAAASSVLRDRRRALSLTK